MHIQKDNLNFVSKFYILFISLCSLPLLIYSIGWFELQRIGEFFFWLALTVLMEYRPVDFFARHHEESVITVTSTVMFTTIIVLGVQGAILVSMLSTFIAELLLKKPLYKSLFNASQYGLTAFISGLVFFELKQSPDSVSFNIVYDWISLIGLIVTHYLINTSIVSLVISLTSGTSFLNVFLYDFKMLVFHHTVSSTLGLAMVSIYDTRHPYVALLFVPPLFMIDLAFRWYYAIHRAATNTLKALADIVDKRDKYTAEHSNRVAMYASKIAAQMKITSEEAQNIEIAASVHDLGKIGVSDSIITKNGALSKEEYELVKKHPEIAYALIKDLRPYEKSAAYILHHHEWMDGTGYPKSLTDREIPIGAKILGVADAYDAMTTNRPYRDAYSPEKAVTELKRCSGTQFDSTVVEALIEVLKEEQLYKES